MKIKERNLVIVYVVIAALLVVGCFGVKYYLDHGLAEQTEQTEADAPQTEPKVVPRETVATTVAKFNTAVMDQTAWGLMPANDETLTVFEGSYWYPLTEEIALVVVPETFTENREVDVTKVALIYIGNEAALTDIARQYWRLLVESNHEDLTAEAAEQLMAEAEAVADAGQMLMDDEGLYVAVKRGDDHTEYQVVRIEESDSTAE